MQFLFLTFPIPITSTSAYTNVLRRGTRARARIIGIKSRWKMAVPTGTISGKSTVQASSRFRSSGNLAWKRQPRQRAIHVSSYYGDNEESSSSYEIHHVHKKLPITAFALGPRHLSSHDAGQLPCYEPAWYYAGSSTVDDPRGYWGGISEHFPSLYNKLNGRQKSRIPRHGPPS